MNSIFMDPLIKYEIAHIRKNVINLNKEESSPDSMPEIDDEFYI